jgi:hypothetical protein
MGLRAAEPSAAEVAAAAPARNTRIHGSPLAAQRQETLDAS